MRLIGIDLLRILASFYVVLEHSPFPSFMSSENSSVLRYVLNTSRSVPFFLLVSLYFNHTSNWGKTIRVISVLFVPYAFWWIVYFFSRLIKTRMFGNAWHPFDDLIGTLVSGGSIQLHFLPMLLSSICLSTILHSALEKLKWNFKVFLVALGLFLHVWLYVSHNEFQLNTNMGMVTLLGVDQSPQMRILGILLSWSISSILLIQISHIFRSYPDFLNKIVFSRWSVLFLVGCSSVALCDFFSPGLRYPLLGTVMFLFGVRLSAGVNRNRWVTRLAGYTFGIYLSHFVFLQAIQMLVVRVFGAHNNILASSAVTMGIAVAGFCASLVLCLCLERFSPKLAYSLLGIKAVIRE